MFDINLLKKTSFNTPIICIGNITVGGTGKTPMAEYLIELLYKEFNIALLSRGYKRKTKGFILADKNSNIHSIGDEPFQVRNKFNDIIVAVDENRVHGVKTLLELKKNMEAIVLDDAYQHRYLKAGVYILLTDYERIYYKDYLIPVGNLREYASAKKRADIIIVTKCPVHLSKEEKETIEKKIAPNPNQQIFFTGSFYKSLIPVFTNNKILHNRNYSVLLLTGIANPAPLYQYLENSYHKIVTLYFKDHHSYSDEDFKKIELKFSGIDNTDKIIITTEKDAVKIRELSNIPGIIKDNIYYIPVYMDFLFNKKPEFDSQILDYVRQNK